MSIRERWREIIDHHCADPCGLAYRTTEEVILASRLFAYAAAGLLVLAAIVGGLYGFAVLCSAAMTP